MTLFEELRITSRLTIAEASELLGVRPTIITAYEAGELVPKPREIQALRGLAKVVQKKTTDAGCESDSAKVITTFANQATSRRQLEKLRSAEKLSKETVGMSQTSNPNFRASPQAEALPINKIARQTLDGEAQYVHRTSVAHRKRFGQFFTPPTVATLMADWVLKRSPLKLLDPAMGTGSLVHALLKRGIDVEATITAYEIDDDIIAYSALGEHPRVRIIHGDFLASESAQSYDAIVMNPPYIRHREIDGYEVSRAQISIASGFIIPKAANLYVYFAMKALLQLRTGGRASFLIPTEWMNANFATTFKRFLLERKFLKKIVIFSGCSNIFNDALTTASVLFLERDNG